MRMPFARSVIARRPKAPSRSWYSAKRRSTMSIELCQSLGRHCDLARDHFVTERGDNRRDEGQAILALVRDQNAQMFGLAVAHSRFSSIESTQPRPIDTRS